MKHTRILFFAAISTSICMENSCVEHVESRCMNCLQKPSNNNVDAEVYVSNFLAIFAHALNLFAGGKPKDPQAIFVAGAGVAQSITNMATGKPASAVAVEARKCVENGLMSAEELLAYVETECTKAQVDAGVTESFIEAIKAEYCKSAILPEETRARYQVDIIND